MKSGLFDMARSPAVNLLGLGLGLGRSLLTGNSPDTFLTAFFLTRREAYVFLRQSFFRVR